MEGASLRWKRSGCRFKVALISFESKSNGPGSAGSLKTLRRLCPPTSLHPPLRPHCPPRHYTNYKWCRSAVAPSLLFSLFSSLLLFFPLSKLQGLFQRFATLACPSGFISSRSEACFIVSLAVRYPALLIKPFIFSSRFRLTKEMPLRPIRRSCNCS